MSIILKFLRIAEQYLRRRRIAWLKTRQSVSPTAFHKARRRFQAYLRLNLIRQKNRQRLEIVKLFDELRATAKEGRELRDRVSQHDCNGSAGSSI